MDKIYLMLTGQMEMAEFMEAFNYDTELRKAISSLIPEEAKNNPTHEIWSITSYETMKRHGFDLYKDLEEDLSFDLSIGDSLNVHSLLGRFYSFWHKDIILTNKYEEEFDCYLACLGGSETYEGPEVDKLVQSIVREGMTIPQKTKRIKAVKERIKQTFHTEDGKKPYWIQGGDWPMGKDSPMKFIKRERDKKDPEKVNFYFQDVTTGDIKIIEQYY